MFTFLYELMMTAACIIAALALTALLFVVITL